jgi:hypothetical protein
MHSYAEVCWIVDYLDRYCRYNYWLLLLLRSLPLSVAAYSDEHLLLARLWQQQMHSHAEVCWIVDYLDRCCHCKNRLLTLLLLPPLHIVAAYSVGHLLPAPQSLLHRRSPEAENSGEHSLHAQLAVYYYCYYCRCDCQ